MSTESGVPRVVILGGGFGGLFAARALAHAPVRVTVVDRHNYHLFQPLLYQVATAALSPGDVAAPIRWVLRRQRNVDVVLADAHRIDAAAGCVYVSATSPSGPDLAVPFDYLILATGAAHAYFGHPEWATRAPGLKTLDDALEMRRQVLLAFEAAEREVDDDRRRRLLTFVIVGAGPTGVELAGALAEIARRTLKRDFRRIRPASARIILIEAADEVLPSFSDRLRASAHRMLSGIGVEVRTGTRLTGIDANGVDLGGERIAAQTVLWAAGVAASPLATSLGVPLDRAGRISADATLAVPGHPHIFVVGDLCALSQDGAPLPGVAQVAMQGGAHAAANIVRLVRGEPPRSFRYRDYGVMAVIGRAAAVARIGPIEASGFVAWIMWIFLHLFWLIGFRHRLAVMAEWAWAYVTMQRRVRLITGERLWPRM